MPIRFYHRWQDLPVAYADLIAAGARRSFFLSRPWFELLERTCLTPGQETCLIGFEGEYADRAPRALLIGRSDPPGNPVLQGTRFSSFTNFYSLDFAPLLPDDGPPAEGELTALFTGIAESGLGCSTITLEALDREAGQFQTLLRALRGAGFLADPVFQFGNWYEDLSGRGYDDYQAGLPKSTRRRARSFDRRDEMTLRIFQETQDIETGIADYQQVFERSWKEPEQFPEFIPGLLRSGVEAGVLRLGLLYVEDRPAAAEIYIVDGRKAISFKASYDEAFQKLGVGTVLTTQMIRHLVDTEGCTEIDFGSGDDPYKQDWLSARRERWRIVAFNPKTLPGLLQAGRHFGGRSLRRLTSGRNETPQESPSPNRKKAET